MLGLLGKGKMTRLRRWFYIQGVCRGMKEVAKTSPCHSEALPALVCCWLSSGLPALHTSQPHCTLILERPRAQDHQSQVAVQRGLGIMASPGSSLSLQEKCALDGGAVSMDDDDDDGWPKESIFHLWAVHVCILTPEPGSDWDPAVLRFPSCCHLFPFTDKWTHFAAWVTHDCLRKSRLTHCGRWGKWRQLFLTCGLQPPSLS